MKKALRTFLAFVIAALCSCSPTNPDNAEKERVADSTAIANAPKDTIKPNDSTRIVPDSGKSVNGANYRGRELDTAKKNNTVQDKYPAKDGVKTSVR